MQEEQEQAAAAALRAALRALADAILDLEARGRLLDESPQLLKLLGDARSRVFAWEVRQARPRGEATPGTPAPGAGESAAVVEEALQREQEAEREWLRTWGRQDDAEL